MKKDDAKLYLDRQVYLHAAAKMRAGMDKPENIGKPDWIVRAQLGTAEFLNAGYRRPVRQEYCATCVELGII